MLVRLVEKLSLRVKVKLSLRKVKVKRSLRVT